MAKKFEDAKVQISKENSALFQGFLAMDMDDNELTKAASYNEENEIKHIEILEEVKEQPVAEKPKTAKKQEAEKPKPVVKEDKPKPVKEDEPEQKMKDVKTPPETKTEQPRAEKSHTEKGDTPKKQKPKADAPDIPTSLLGGVSQAPAYPRLISKETGEILELTKDEVILGRKKSDVDVVIDSEFVSRQHAKFIINNDKYYISDLESSNGTFLNGDRLPTKTMFEIRDGNEIKIANETFEFDSNKRKDK